MHDTPAAFSKLFGSWSGDRFSLVLTLVPTRSGGEVSLLLDFVSEALHLRTNGPLEIQHLKAFLLALSSRTHSSVAQLETFGGELRLVAHAARDPDGPLAFELRWRRRDVDLSNVTPAGEAGLHGLEINASAVEHWAKNSLEQLSFLSK